MPSCTASAPASNTSTSAAASASTTTARRPTSNRPSTTRCRNTPTTSSSASRASATRPACRTRRSSPRSGRAVVAYHSVLVFDVLGVSNFDRYDLPPKLADDASSRSSTCYSSTATCQQEELSRRLPRRRAGDGRVAQPVQPRLPADRAAQPWPNGSSGPSAARFLKMVREAGLRARGVAGPGVDALGHLLLQLLGLPVDAR